MQKTQIIGVLLIIAVLVLGACATTTTTLPPETVTVTPPPETVTVTPPAATVTVTPTPTPTLTPTPTPTPTQGANEVSAHDNFFVPDFITVPVGTTVTWTSVGLEPHTVSGNADLFDVELSFGDSYSHTFTEPGRYDYHCMIHHADKMEGVVIVE